MRAAVDLLTIVAVFGPLSTLLVLRVLPVLKQNDTPSVYTREYEVYWDDHLCTAVSRPASLVVSSMSYKQSGKSAPEERSLGVYTVVHCCKESRTATRQELFWDTSTAAAAVCTKDRRVSSELNDECLFAVYLINQANEYMRSGVCDETKNKTEKWNIRMRQKRN